MNTDPTPSDMKHTPLSEAWFLDLWLCAAPVVRKRATEVVGAIATIPPLLGHFNSGHLERAYIAGLHDGSAHHALTARVKALEGAGETLRALAEMECVNADPDSHAPRSVEQMLRDTNKELYFTKVERQHFKEELAKFKLIEANLQESCKRLEHTLEAYRKRARKLYTPDVAATKIAEDEARMRDVDKRLAVVAAVLKYYGLEVVSDLKEGDTMLMTPEDNHGIKDCAYVRVIPGGLFAGDQSELKILREEFDKAQKTGTALQARALLPATPKDEKGAV